MLLTSWLSSLRSNRFSRRLRKSDARKRKQQFVRQAEQLEDRTLLTAFIVESLNLAATPGVGINVTNADIIGTGTQANPEFQSLVIETATTDSSGITIDLDNIWLDTITIESVNIVDFDGTGIDIDLDNVMGLRTLVIDSVDVHGTGGAGVDLNINDMTIRNFTVLHSNIDGVHVFVNDATIDYGRINSNAITGGVGVDGIVLKLTGNTDVDGFSIANNTQISSITEDSILFDFDGVAVDGLIVEDNVFATGAILNLDFVIDGDTYKQFFEIRNNSAYGQSLEKFVFDIGPTGLVFDIDPITGRPFTPEPDSALITGYVDPALVDDGGTTLEIDFTNFNPEDSFEWQIDLDIEGAQTSVFGNELIGSTVTLTYSGGQEITGTLVAVPGLPDAAKFVTAQGGAGGSGIKFDLDRAPLTNLELDNNIIEGNSGFGVLFNAFKSDVHAVISNNEINATAEDGVSFNLVDSNFTGEIDSNAIGANAKHGISFNPSVDVSGLVASIPDSGPIVVITLGHALNNGDLIVVSGIAGEDFAGIPVFGHDNSANGVYVVGAVTTNSFELRDVDTGAQVLANSNYKGGGRWFRVEDTEAGNITGASNQVVGDIEITAPGHGMVGDQNVVTVQHVTGNLKANGTYRVNVTSVDTFELIGVGASGDYMPGPAGISGVWYKTFIVDVRDSIVGNAISANLGAGINVDLPQGAVFLGELKQNVVVRNRGIGFNLTTLAGSFDLNVGTGDDDDSNTFDRNVGAGVAVNVLDTGSGSYRVRNNRFTAQQADPSNPTFEGAGFHTRLEGTLPAVEASSNLAISLIDGNTFGVDHLGNSGPGVLFAMAEGTRIDVLDVTDNTFINNRDDGFRFFRRDDADLNLVLVDSNTFEGNRGDGAELFGQNTTRDPLDWEISNNIITNNGEYGIRIRVEADARVQANLTDNVIDRNGNISSDPNPNATGTVGGIGLSAFQAVEVLMNLDNNRIIDNFGDGFVVDAINPFDTLRLSGDWTNNAFDGNRDNGVRTDGIAFGWFTWTDNTFNENGMDGAILLNSDDIEIRTMLRNEFMLNAADGLHLGRAINTIIGDGTVVNRNFFMQNSGDGMKLTQAQSPYLSFEERVDSVGRPRHRDILVYNNLFLDNGSAGIDAEAVGFVRLVIDESIFEDNLGDGLEWKGTAGDNELTIRDSHFEGNGDFENVGDAQGGRGIDFLQAGGGTTDFNVFDSIIKSNAYEGVYVVNSADLNQPQERPDDPLLDGGNSFANPHINFRFRDNIVESNGNSSILATIPLADPTDPATPLAVSSPNLGTNQGTLGGLVIRPGTVDSDGRIGQPWPIETFIVTSNGQFVPRTQLDGAGIDAEVSDNFFDGNFGSEVYFDSFRSTNPATTLINWNSGENYVATVLERDPLSRFDLVFTGNETNPNNSIDLLNGYAWHNNSEDEFKSRAARSTAPQHTHANNPSGAHAPLGIRRRNATRTLGNPQDIVVSPDTHLPHLYFGFDGEGRSTWRVEPGWDIDSDFQTSEIFGFSDFETTVVLGGSTGELNYDWDIGEATLGNPFSDTLSLEKSQVLGKVIEPDIYEINDPTTPYTDTDSILTAHNFGDLVSTIDINGLTMEHGNEDDYYKFVVQNTGTMTIDLFFDVTVGDLDAELYEITPFEELVNTEEKLIGWATLHGVDDAQITADVVAGKEYVLRVFGFSTRMVGATDNEFHPGTTDNYRMVIPLPIGHDQHEENDTFEDATNLGPVSPTGVTESLLTIHRAAYDTPGSGVIDEIEGNDTIWTAQDLTNAPWWQGVNTNLEDFRLIDPEDQKQLHNITIHATGDGTFDYFRFNVPVDNARAIFDIDFGTTGNPTDVNTEIFVYDSDGNLLSQGLITAENDDAIPGQENSTGSISPLDSFLINPFVDLQGRPLFFATAGEYIVGVASFDSEADQNGVAGDEVPVGSEYFLSIMIEDHQLGDPGDVDFFSFVAPSIDELAASRFYSIDLNTNSLVGIDRFTGAVSTIGGPLSHTMHSTDMVLHNGVLYAVTPDSDDIQSLPNWNLVEINPTTGAVTNVTAITVDDNGIILDANIIEGIAVRDGVLLVVYDIDELTTSTIGEIDPATGIITENFDYDNLALGNQDYDGISLRPDGRLIAVSQTMPINSDNNIEFIELEDGPFGITSTGNYSAANADVSDMATDGTQLFGLDHGRNELVFLDPIDNGTILTSVSLPDGFDLTGLATEYTATFGKFYSVDYANDLLMTVDPITGAVDPVSGNPIGFDMQPATDLTYLDGLIYAVTSDTQLISNANVWSLVTIDPVTGVMTRAVRLQLDLQNSDPTRVEGITARNGEILIAYDPDTSTRFNPDIDFTSTIIGIVDVVSGDVTPYIDYEQVTGTNFDFDALAVTLGNTLLSLDNQGIGTVEYFDVQEFPFAVNSLGTDFRVNRGVSDLAVDVSGIFGLDNGRDELLTLDPTDPSRVIRSLPLVIGTSMLSGLTSDLNARTTVDYGALEVEIAAVDLTEDIDLEIYDSEMNLIHTSNSDDGREVITFNYVPGEKYFARVFGAPQHNSRNYSLNIKQVNPDANETANGDIGNETFENATDLGQIFDGTVSGTIHRHTELAPAPDVPVEENNSNTTLILSEVFPRTDPRTFAAPFLGGWQDLRDPAVTPWTLTPNANVGAADENTSISIPHASVHGFVDFTPEVHYYLVEIQNFGDRLIVETDNSNFNTEVFVFNRITGAVVATNDNSAGGGLDGGGGTDAALPSTDSLADTLLTPLPPGEYVIGVSTTAGTGNNMGIIDGLMPRGAEYTLHISIENQPLSPPIVIDPGDQDVFRFIPDAPGASDGFSFPDFSMNTGDLTTVADADFANGTAFLNGFVSSVSGLTTPNGMAFGPDGNLYVTNSSTDIFEPNSVLRFDGTTGAFIDVFVSSGDGALMEPKDLIFLPNGDLLVSSFTNNLILRYDGDDGSFDRIFITTTGNALTNPDGMAIGSDGNLYVVGTATNNVNRYDISGAVGVFIDAFVAANSAGLDEPTKLAFGPADDDLYVSSSGSDEVLFYHGPGQDDGAMVPMLIEGTPVNPPGVGNTGVFVSDSEGGLDKPQGLVFDANGDLLVASEGTDSILRYVSNGIDDDGDFVGVFVPAGSAGLDAPQGLIIEGGEVYVASSMSNEVLVAEVPVVLQITPTDPNSQTGAAWYTDNKQFVSSFDTTFEFQLNGNLGGASGFAFVIQNDDANAIGNGGAGLGYEGITDSIAFEFDLFDSAGARNDPNDNHVSIHTRGAARNSANESANIGRFTPTFDLDDGQVHTARIAYTGGALSVYLDDLFNPAITIFTDIPALVGASVAWVGFTGSAFEQSAIDILSWDYTGYDISDTNRDYQIRLDFEHEKGDLKLELFDPTFSLTTPIAVSDTSGLGADFERFGETLSAGRTYFVRVSGAIDLSPLSADAPMQANGGAQTAYTLIIDDLNTAPLFAEALVTPAIVDETVAETTDELPIIEDDSGLVDPFVGPVNSPDFPVDSSETGLSRADLDEIFSAAKTYWTVSGLSTAQQTALDAATISIADMPGFQIGSATGLSLTIDTDAAGYGWYVDPEPFNTYEFTSKIVQSQYFAEPDSLAYGKMDLLTTVLHELGHTVGLVDLNGAGSRTDLMAASVSPSERRLPLTGQALGATPDNSVGDTTHFLVDPVEVDYFDTDTIDVNVGDDVAEDTDGNVSLRAAIMETNASPGPDIINVEAGTVALTINGNGEDESATGDLDITDDLTIVGAGKGLTFIDGSALFDRVFHIHPGAVVTLSNMTITGGSGFFGGSILDEGTLFLDNVEIIENFSEITVDYFAKDTIDADVGDGAPIDADGKVSLRAAIMETNDSVGDDIININAGTVSLTIDRDGENESAQGDLDITGNLKIHGAGVGQTIIDGSAIFDRVLHIHPGAVVTLSNMTITGGSGLFGGGILNEGILVLENVAVVDNVTSSRGGGIYNSGDLTLTQATVSGNHADSRGGGLFNNSAASRTTIIDSSFFGNTAASRGGSIFNEGGSIVIDDDGVITVETGITVVGSTISGNFSDSSGGGVFNEGTMDIVNVTITDNATDKRGGGILNADGGRVGIQNNVIAVNSADPALAAGNDLAGDFVTLGNNFIGDGVGAVGISDGIGGDQVGGGFIAPKDPALLPLDDYGGPTLTHMPNIGSPLRDAGENLAATEDDQRGFERIFDGDFNETPVIDIGSVEANFFSFAGHVWQDTNENDIDDNSEPGIFDVQVELWEAGFDQIVGGGDDVLKGGVLTDSQGNYLFEDLFVGHYYVRIILATGHVYSAQDVGSDDNIDSDVNIGSGRSDVFFLTGGANDQPQDAGMIPLAATVETIAFTDSNSDGSQLGEDGRNDVTVELWSTGPNQQFGGGDDSLIATDAVSDGNGEYSFSGLDAGYFYLSFSTPTGVAFTSMDLGSDAVDSDVNPYTGRTEAFFVVAGATHDSHDAGYVPESKIGDKVFADFDGNGINDGAFGAGGIQVDLYEAGPDNEFGGGDDIFIGSTTTSTVGIIGAYEFTNLAAGDYYLEFAKLDGFVYTLPNVGDDDTIDSDVIPADLRTEVFALASGVYDDTRDAGLIEEAKVGSRAFKDTDADGRQDFGELGIAGIDVELWSAGADDQVGGDDDVLIATQTTNANGDYLFDSIDPGMYFLVFGEAQNLDFTLQDVGGNTSTSDVVDSDADANGVTGVFLLEIGDVDLSRDAGYVDETQVGNRVWEDLNQDGIQQTNEPGVEDVTVRLYAGPLGPFGASNYIAQTTTDADGLYRFGELQQGLYYIEVEQPEGFSFTLQKQGGVGLQDSDITPLTGQSEVFQLQGGSFDMSRDAGIVPGANVGNFLWQDVNTDGQQQDGEPGVPGVQVDLFNVGPDGLIGGGDDTLARSTTTSSDTDTLGEYEFLDLPAETYYVLFTDQAGFIFTNANMGPDESDSDVDFSGLSPSFAIAPGETNDTIDAGLIVHTDSRIGNLVFNDLNRDGIQDPGEYGIGGVRVELFAAGVDGEIGGGDDALVKHIHTNANGRYAFTNLSPRRYYVGFEEPVGFDFTLKDQGSDDLFDSDVTPNTGLIDAFTLASGQNNQSFDAGLIDLSQAPGVPVLIGPDASDSDTTPTVEWEPVPGATSFEFLMYNTRLGKQVLKDLSGTPIPGNETTFTVPDTHALAPDDYQVFVRSVNGNGRSSYSAPRNFTVTGQIPTRPTLTAPVGSTEDTTPTIEWTDVAVAATYEILVYHVQTGREVINSKGITDNEFTPSAPMPAGVHQAFVRAVNSLGASPYSSPLFFTVAGTQLGAPTIVAPIGTTNESRPVIDWTDVNAAESYDLLVYNVDSGQEVINEKGITPSEFKPTVALVSARHQAFVRAVNTNTTSPFSVAFNFTVDLGAGASDRPRILSPTGQTNDSTPTIRWSAVTAATTYELLVYNIDAGQQVVGATNIVPTQYTVALPLANGRYQAFVRAITPSGPSQYSEPAFFDIVRSEADIIDETELPADDELRMFDANIQLAGLFDEPLDAELQFTSTSDDSPTPAIAVVESSEADVNIVSEYGWKAQPLADTQDVEELDSVMSEWPELDWWTEESTEADTETAETVAMADESDSTLADTSMAIAGAFAALVAHRLIRKDETDE